jgi:hypothetical protein
VLKLRPLDWAALAVNIAVLGFFSWYAYGQAGAGPALYIQGESASWVYPLDKDEDLHIPGPIGETHISIQGGAAHVASSPCRDKICVYMGSIAKKGEWIACLPNRVFIRVDSKEEGEVDATVF